VSFAVALIFLKRLRSEVLTKRQLKRVSSQFRVNETQQLGFRISCHLYHYRLLGSADRLYIPEGSSLPSVGLKVAYAPCRP
jgi:hypothetical protein